MSSPQPPPFPHVFKFLNYFRRSSLSFCSSEVWNTALESLGKHESTREKKYLKSDHYSLQKSRKTKSINSQAGQYRRLCLTSCCVDGSVRARPRNLCFLDFEVVRF